MEARGVVPVKLDAVGQWDLLRGYHAALRGEMRDNTNGGEWLTGWNVGRQKFLELKGIPSQPRKIVPRFSQLPAIKERLRVGRRAA